MRTPKSQEIRIMSCRLGELMDEGVIDPEWLAQTCLAWMSEDDVRKMIQFNDLEELVADPA